MDIISGAASIGGVIVGVLQVTTWCKIAVARYRNAPVTLHTIGNHCTAIELGLEKVRRLLEKSWDSFKEEDRLLDTVRSTVAGCSSLIDSLWRDVLQPYEPNFSRSVRAKVVWKFAELDELAKQLHRSATSLLILLTLMNSTHAENLNRSNAERLTSIESQIGTIVELIQTIATYSQRKQGRRRIEEVETGCPISFEPLLRLSPSPVSGDEQRLSSAGVPIWQTDPHASRLRSELTILTASVTAQTQTGHHESEIFHNLVQGPRSNSPIQAQGLGRQTLRRRRHRGRLKPDPFPEPSAKNSEKSRDLHSPLPLLQPLWLASSGKKSPDFRVGRRSRSRTVPPAAFGRRPQESNYLQLARIPNLGLATRSLFDAIQTHDYKLLQHLINTGADITIIDKNGHSAFNEAVNRSDFEACRRLLEAGVSPETQCGACHRGMKSIHLATLRGNVGLVQLLLQHKADPDSRWISGVTALHLAAKRGLHKVIPVLISAGASPSSLDSRRNTPLHLAVVGCQAHCAARLLEHDLNPQIRFVDAENGDGKRAVQLAIELGWIDGLSLLHQFGADIHLVDSRGGTLLHMVARLGLQDAIYILVAAGLDVDSRDQMGMSPLHVTVVSKYDSRSMVRELLRNGASLHARCRPEVLSRLLSLSSGLLDPDSTCPATAARPDFTSWHGPTPLLLAAKVARKSTIQCLLDAGANLRDKNTCGCDVLRAARFNPHGAVFRLLFAESFRYGSHDCEGSRNLQMLALTVAGEHEFSRLRDGIFGPDPNAGERFPPLAADVINNEHQDQRRIQRRCRCCPQALDHVREAITACRESRVSIFAPFRGKSALRRAAHNGFVAETQLLLEQEPGPFANSEAGLVYKSVLRSRFLAESTRDDVLEALRQCTSRPIDRDKYRRRKSGAPRGLLRRLWLRFDHVLAGLLCDSE